jgi:hypothetical protein
MTGLALVPKRSLFEHIRDVEGIADLVDALDDANELTPELSAELSEKLIRAIAGTKSRVDDCAGILAHFEAAEAAAIAERTRLDARARYFARQHDRLTEYVLAVLTASKLDRIDGETSTLARHRNPPRVVIDDDSAVPTEFLRWPDPLPDPDPEPDRNAIKAAIRGGAEVPGCRLQTTYKLVRS